MRPVMRATACTIVACAQLGAAKPYFGMGQDRTNAFPRIQYETRPYKPNSGIAPLTANGIGLSNATTGVSTTFNIRPAPEHVAETEGVEWNVDKHRFIYVWIANADHIFTAGVVNNGDGTLTASYQSSLPGDYLVYVEDVNLHVQPELDRARPIQGSPFSLTIAGEPTVDIEGLPPCDVEDYSVHETYFREGSWISSNIVGSKRGVLREGWVFQPHHCAYETFSPEDLMHLASLDEQTWLLALGNSILRGTFLTLVDMVLDSSQKADLPISVLSKCWGFADIRIGSLRLTYQDWRLYTVTSVEDATVCNDEKLESGSTAVYVTSARRFLAETIFPEDEAWPTVIWTPSNMVDEDEAANIQIDILLDAIPPAWDGNLVFLDHLYGFYFVPSRKLFSDEYIRTRVAKGFGWNTANPTLTALEDLAPVNEHSIRTPDCGLARMGEYQKRYRRTTFMSVFPMYQAKIFENERTRFGRRCYGCSIHYHYMSDASSPEAFGGAWMVHSSMTEMLANIIIAKAVGTRAELHERGSRAQGVQDWRSEARRTFEVCTDCPASLMPYHVKAVPELACEELRSLAPRTSKGKVWDMTLCPDWCMASDPVSTKDTVSGAVAVRVCTSTPPQQP